MKKTKKPIARKQGAGEERERMMDAVYKGALAVIAKHKAAKEAAAKEVAPAIVKPKQQKEVVVESHSKLARGNTVTYKGKSYMFFRTNKQKQAILIAQDGGERVIADPTQLT